MLLFPSVSDSEFEVLFPEMIPCTVDIVLIHETYVYA